MTYLKARLNARPTPLRSPDPGAPRASSLRRKSEAAAAAIRALSEEELVQSAPISLYGDAPLTCQFMLEDHAVRHRYHHLARIRAALKS